jgi:glycine/D-amino acid oxidase-like deaminating enzyme/nitrite reductase/ring-hydroxylating ferredoxin subunit
MPDHTTELGGRTTSIWHRTVELPHFAPLSATVSTDVCVIGAGIAGLSTAYALARAGRRVVVLDDGPIGGGETGRTTAHLTCAMDDRIYRLEHVHGESGARMIVESHLAAIQHVDRLVTAEEIDCDFRRVDGFLFAGQGDDQGTLEREYAAARRAGLSDVQLIDRAPIADYDTGRALRFHDQAQFHPLRYLAGLAAAITRRGGAIHCGNHVTAVKGGATCVVDTDNGYRVNAEAVCVCTNGSITDYVRTHALQAPYRTYVIAAVIPRGSVLPALYWDTESPYHYVRTQPLDPPIDGVSRGDTSYDALIVGGEDHKTAHEDDAGSRWTRLEQWMRQRWPHAREVVFRWSGQVLEPADYLAFIGPNPDGAENVYMVSGDSGQGMTHGVIAGLLLPDLIAGKANPWADIYDPRRVTLSASTLGEVAKENADVAVQYVKDFLSPGDVASTDDIQPGQGRIVRRGFSKIAAYRDDSGTLHERSALCTHLKCVVDWNSAEKSWDCPCHGSRFDPYGKVLNGPAVEDLGQP